VELNTARVRPKERLDYWRETALRRMELQTVDGAGRPFQARIHRLAGKDVEFLDYSSDAIWLSRTQQKCDEDGIDEISVGLALATGTGAQQNGHDLLLRRDELYVIDFARPVRSLLANHHELAIMLPRRRVAEAIGAEVEALGGRRLALDGIGLLLGEHLRALAAHGARLTPEEQAVALSVAADLALATLKATLAVRLDPDRCAGEIYVIACSVIDYHCGDPMLTPAGVAGLAGCSRATLYRVMARHGEGVADEIWRARLARAWHLLTAAALRDLPLSEIAFRSGFLDPASFSRMFKRRYGLTPTELRITRGSAVGCLPERD
jgi:AraC-like DNA-binding protein